jgi:MYXO-CTERM domain-containing protein
VGRPLDTVWLGGVISESAPFAVTGSFVHPRYDFVRAEIEGNVDPWPVGSAWDVALVEVSDAGGTFAPLAIAPLGAAEDALAAGTALSIAGFGIIDPPDGYPAERFRGATAVHSIVTTERAQADLVIVDESRGAAGPCFGDSGGPAIVDVGGELRVAGVASGNVAVVAPCADKATYARASQAEGFVAAVRAGETPAAESCTACAIVAGAPGGACEATAAALAGPGFAALQACLAGATWDQCAAADPLAAADLQAQYDCLVGACAACTPGIAALARCGLDYDGAGPCANCLVASAECCALLARCEHDPACQPCVNRTDFPPSCLDDALFADAISCTRGACDEACGAFLAYAPTPGADAGPEDAGALDAGALDAGPSDAGSADAAQDPGADAGPRVPRGDDGGCGCRAAGHGAAPLHAAAPLALALALALRRLHHRPSASRPAAR